MHTEPNVNVRVSHRYAASAERLFDAWLDPAMISRFIFSPMPGDEVVRINIDARVGGRFSFVVRREGQELDHIGEYLEIDRPRRLAFTWGVRTSSAPPDMSQVEIDIAPLESGSELTLTHQLHPDWADYAARTESGWNAILSALEHALSQ